MQLTHVGGPTVLIELAGWRILTDPTFDPPGRRYTFGWGTSSRKLSGPTADADHLAPVDLVLLSHDHHADNLDEMGRRMLASATTVVTPGRLDADSPVPMCAASTTGPARSFARRAAPT